MKSLGEPLGASAFTERFGAGKIGLRSFSAVRFDVERSGSVCLLHVNGEIDIYSSAELEAKIADLGREQRGEILVSFVLCNFIDCSGLRILIRQFKQLGNRLLIVAPPASALYRILDLAGLATVLPVHKGLHEACFAIAPDVTLISRRYTMSA
jgi:anti-anti-sigma factor